MYEVDELPITELITSATNGVGLNLKFMTGRSVKEIWFVSDTPKGIELKTSAGLLQNGRIQIPSGLEDFEVSLLVREQK